LHYDGYFTVFGSSRMTPPDPLRSRSRPDAHAHLHEASHRVVSHTGSQRAPARSVLAWPAWLRVAAVMPLLCMLWLAVWWANEGVNPW
jgi:hypothetical protein